MTRNKKLLIKAVLTDSVGMHAEAVWFNQRMILSKFHQGDEVILFGKPKYEYGRLSFPSAEIEHIGPNRREIQPVYSDINYIPGSWIREKMAYMRPYLDQIHEIIPEEIRVKKSFRTRRENVHDLHFPTNKEAFDRSRRELGYEELFRFQMIGIEKKYEAR
jgi:ATP-dependent DNA helicase RecG